MTNAATDNPYSFPSALALTEQHDRHRQQVATVGTMYAGYSTSMILRMIPTVAGSSIVADSALGIDLTSWSVIVASGTMGSLISVLIGGFVFDRLDRRIMARVMGGLLLIATGCIVAFSIMPQWSLSEQQATLISLGLLFVFGLCVSPCYYIPASVFSIDFGGPHSGFLVAILDAVGFEATGPGSTGTASLPEATSIRYSAASLCRTIVISCDYCVFL